MEIDKIPFFGYIFCCDIENHKEAFVEWSSTVFVSLLPLLAGWITVSFLGTFPTIFYDQIFVNIGNGELFVYCSSIVAPVFTLSIIKKKGYESYPYRHFIMIMFLVVTIFSIIFFTLKKTGQELNVDLVFKSSVVLFIVSVILLYLSIVLHNSRVDPPGRMKQQESEFDQGYAAHRRR